MGKLTIIASYLAFLVLANSQNPVQAAYMKVETPQGRITHDSEYLSVVEGEVISRGSSDYQYNAMRSTGKLTVIAPYLTSLVLASSQNPVQAAYTEFETPQGWITDGSEYLSVVEGEVISRGSGDYQYNAMWKEGAGLTSGEAYWIFKFRDIKRIAFVGITNDTMFKPGYRIRCFCYGENLGNGNALLVSGFGPRIKENDEVGLIASITGDRLKVYFIHNKRSLGLAFDVPADAMPGARPVVLISGAGSVSLRGELPVPLDRRRAATTHHGIEGTWRLLKFKESEKQIPVPSLQDERIIPTLKIARVKCEDYDVGAQIMNTLFLKWSNYNGEWSGQPISTTLVGVSSDVGKYEAQLYRHLKTVRDVHGSLIIIGDNSESTWERYDDSPTPYFQP